MTIKNLELINELVNETKKIYFTDKLTLEIWRTVAVSYTLRRSMMSQWLHGGRLCTTDSHVVWMYIYHHCFQMQKKLHCPLKA